MSNFAECRNACIKFQILRAFLTCLRATIVHIQWTNVYHFTECKNFSLVYARIFHIQWINVYISFHWMYVFKFWISRAFLTCLRAHFSHPVNECLYHFTGCMYFARISRLFTREFFASSERMLYHFTECEKWREIQNICIKSNSKTC